MSCRTRLRATRPLVLCAAFLLGSAQAAECPPSTPDEAAVQALHARVLSIDTHIDFEPTLATVDYDPGVFTRAQFDLPKARAGGLDAAFLVLYSGQGALDAAGYAKARALIEDKYQAIQRMIRAYPDQVALATSADEVRALHAAGKWAVLMGMENAYPLGSSLDEVPFWAARGVRYMSITHMGNNQFGGSSNPDAKLGDPAEDPGLNALGRQLVAALNDAGIIVDVSHVGRQTVLDAARLSRAPILASHSGVKGVHDNLRNLDDEELEAIRKSGGVAQMVAFRSYIGEVDPAVREGGKALAQKYFPNGWDEATPEQFASFEKEMHKLRAAHTDIGVARFVDHIDYAVKRIGVAHVGIASDFGGGGGVQGWDDAAETANVTRELMRRCYDEDAIRALWGGNLLRVLDEVQAKAKS